MLVMIVALNKRSFIQHLVRDDGVDGDACISAAGAPSRVAASCERKRHLRGPAMIRITRIRCIKFRL